MNCAKLQLTLKQVALFTTWADARNIPMDSENAVCFERSEGGLIARCSVNSGVLSELTAKWSDQYEWELI